VVSIGLLVGGGVRAAETLPAGVASHWPFDGDGTDVAGGRDLVLNGAPVFVAGQDGQALALSGAGQWAARSAADAVFDFGAGDFTIRTWVRFDDATQTSQQVVNKWTAPSSGWYLRYNGGGTFQFSDGFGSVNFSGTGAVQSGRWHHVLVRRSGNSLELFLDCVRIGSQTTAAALGAATEVLAVGRRLGTTGGNFPEYLKGAVDGLAIWTRALTQSEADSLCALPPADAGAPPADLASPDLGPPPDDLAASLADLTPPPADATAGRDAASPGATPAGCSCSVGARSQSAPAGPTVPMLALALAALLRRRLRRGVGETICLPRR
jgi:MYXO-CTERM domain-containing protein